jgi:hypothetical protein
MSEALKPWYAVALPHEDIRKGEMGEDVFAANIWSVVQGKPPEVYLDAEEFFRKTYLTAGLVKVLTHVTKALAGGGEKGDRIISLQTPFGGGKTHTLVALWHLAKHADKLRKSPACADLRSTLAKPLSEPLPAVAVFTNRTCDATQGRRTAEGVHTRTLWGELAVQLGGKKLYEKVRANDEAQRTTQGLFADVLRAAAPCLVLLDELADYCVGAAAVPVGESTLADQTISFIQELTEAVQEVPSAVVVATLPASKMEVANSEKGQEAFTTLEKRFYRLGADVKLVDDDEIPEVVRRRLFETIAEKENADYPAKVAAQFQAMYSEHGKELPAEACKASYREDIERSYPFHPSMIDALYRRWGSHPDFQRTRGVLRLLASIVGDLWHRRKTTTQSQPLIQPCHIRWSLDALNAALGRLWGANFPSVAAADVIGEKSNAGIFDEERGGDYRNDAIGQGLAAAVLLGSFGGQGEKSGYSAKDLKVACSRPGLNWSYTDGALLELENRCFYLHTTAAGSLGKRYWFGTKPNLNKLVVQYRQRVATETFEQEIIEALEGHARSGRRGEATWRLVIDPKADLPEQKSLTLLVLPPNGAFGDDETTQAAVRRRVLEISQRCGAKDRQYRNTLLFLAPSVRGISKLRQAHRERATLLGVRRDYADQLDPEQQDDLKKRLEGAERAAAEALGPAYVVALRVHKQEIEDCTLTDARASFDQHLEYLWTTLVEDEDWIVRRVGGVTLQSVGLLPKESPIRVKDAVDAFLRFTDKPLVASKEAVTAGIAQACADGLVGIARGTNPATLQARYCRKVVTIDPSENGIWIIPAFEETTTSASTTPGGVHPAAATGVRATGPEPMPGRALPAASGCPEGPPSASLRYRRLRIEGSVPLESYGELFRCFVGPAARMNLKKLDLGIGFVFEAQDGKPFDANDSAVKAMQEAARQLGLKLAGED